MRGKKLVQLIRILGLLSRPGGVTKKQISETLNITPRSVSRIIRMVEDMGIPVYDERIPFEREKCWKIESSCLFSVAGVKIPDIALNYPEIISLCMLAGESAVFRGTEIGRQIDTAIAKLILLLPEETRAGLSELKRIFICKTIGSKTYADKENILRKLTESIIDNKVCRITYHTFYRDEVTEQDIGPLHFYENRGGLYLFALKLKAKKIRSYAVERIQRILSLSKSFSYPKKFRPEEVLNSAFDLIHGEPVNVKIRFSPKEAIYIKEKTWAPDQQILDHPDGSVTLTMTSSGYRDIKRWVMSFGKEALLLEPEEMKLDIETEMEECLKNMKKK